MGGASSKNKDTDNTIKYIPVNNNNQKSEEHQFQSNEDINLNGQHNSIICFENNYYSKNNNPPKRLSNFIIKNKITKELSESKMEQHNLRKSIRLDCLKNIVKNENNRKLFVRLNLSTRQNNVKKPYLPKINWKHIITTKKNKNNELSNINNRIKLSENFIFKQIKDEKRHQKASNNHIVFINKRVNKLKLHNFIVKQRATNNSNIIFIKMGKYYYKHAPERLLMKSPLNKNEHPNIGYCRKELKLNLIKTKANKYNNYLKMRNLTNNERKQNELLLLKRKVIYKHKFVAVKKSLNATYSYKILFTKNGKINDKKLKIEKNNYLVRQFQTFNLNKHIMNQKLLIKQKSLNLHYKNWLIDNIKNKIKKAQINRMELFDNNKFTKSLPQRLLNNIRINLTNKNQQERINSANYRRENLISIMKKRLKESRELFCLKRNFINQNQEINKSFKNVCLNQKFKIASLSKNHQKVEKNELMSIKQQELNLKKSLFDQQKLIEREKRKLKIDDYNLKIDKLSKNKENKLYEKHMKNENRSKKISNFKIDELSRINNLKEKIENKNKNALDKYNQILTDKINKLHLHNNNIKTIEKKLPSKDNILYENKNKSSQYENLKNWAASKK